VEALYILNLQYDKTFYGRKIKKMYHAVAGAYDFSLAKDINFCGIFRDSYRAT